MSRDPWRGSIWNPATKNGYNYANVNPSNRIDPTGYCAEFGDDGLLECL